MHEAPSTDSRVIQSTESTSKVYIRPTSLLSISKMPVLYCIVSIYLYSTSKVYTLLAVSKILTVKASFSHLLLSHAPLFSNNILSCKYMYVAPLVLYTKY